MWTSCLVLALGTLALSSALERTSFAAPRQESLNIVEVELRGLSRVSVGEIEAQLTVKAGALYDAAELEAEYQRLFKTRQFRFIETEVERVPGGVKIILIFTERELVSRIRLDGVEGLDRTTLLELRRTRIGELLDESQLRYDRSDLERLYREKGYLFATVSTQTTPHHSGGVVVTFVANEGPQVNVESISFHGNDTFDSGELDDLLQTHVRSTFFGFPNSGHFQEDLYLEDLANVRAFYRNHGFFDVLVAAEDFAFNRDRSELHLGIRVEEGDRYQISSIQIVTEGTGVFPETILRDKIKVEQGDFWNGEVLQTGLTEIRRMYWDRAYIDVNPTVTPVVAETDDQVSLLVEIREGEKSFVEFIEIRGNEETRDKVVRRELPIFPGDEISYSKLEDGRSNLFRLRYFEDVRFRFEEGSTPSQKNVVFDLEETSTGRLLFGFGVTSGRGLIGNIALRKENFDLADLPESFFDLPDAFTGGGQRLILEASPGTEFSRYRGEFFDPHLFDSDTSFRAQVFKVDFQRREYRDDRVGFELGLGQRFPFDRNLTAELTYRMEVVDVRRVEPDAPPDVFRVAGSTRISGLGLEARYDRRTYRHLVGPVDGWLASAGYEYLGGFLGGELDVSKASATLSVHETMFSDGDKKRHILTFRNFFAWSEPHHNSSEVPIYERYYLGGSRNLRGFRFNGVGPMFFKQPLGGTARQNGSLQYSFPLYEETLRGVFFVDYGNLARDLEHFSLKNYRLAAGAGILINIPFLGQNLPISVSWGEAILEEDTDRTRNFLFDIGIGF